MGVGVGVDTTECSITRTYLISTKGLTHAPCTPTAYVRHQPSEPRTNVHVYVHMYKVYTCMSADVKSCSVRRTARMLLDGPRCNKSLTLNSQKRHGVVSLQCQVRPSPSVFGQSMYMYWKTGECGSESSSVAYHCFSLHGCAFCLLLSLYTYIVHAGIYMSG